MFDESPGVTYVCKRKVIHAGVLSTAKLMMVLYREPGVWLCRCLWATTLPGFVIVFGTLETSIRAHPSIHVGNPALVARAFSCHLFVLCLPVFCRLLLAVVFRGISTKLAIMPCRVVFTKRKSLWCVFPGFAYYVLTNLFKRHHTHPAKTLPPKVTQHQLQSSWNTQNHNNAVSVPFAGVSATGTPPPHCCLASVDEFRLRIFVANK